MAASEPTSSRNGPTDALKVVATAPIAENVWTHVMVRYDGSAKASGVSIYYDGKKQPKAIVEDRLDGPLHTDVPLKIGQRGDSSRLESAALHDVRVYGRALSDDEAAKLGSVTRAIELVRTPADQRLASQIDAVYGWWIDTIDESSRTRREAVAVLEKEEAGIKRRGTVAHVAQEKDAPAMAYVLFRGEYDKRRDEVKADTPSFLPAFPDDAPRNRLGLARWLLAPEHPLTARVTVNRFWQEVFGQGLVRTTGDLGTSGELPSHPELLDWLAVEFRESGWDVKGLFRLILTSSAYRQAATLTPEKLAADPANRLLSRGPRFRMEAEMVRDFALASSGLLVPKVGGPSVKPYQPEGVWEAIAMKESDTKKYVPTRATNSTAAASTPSGNAPRPRDDGDLQRPQPRDLHRRPRAHQHPPPGPGDPQRHPVHRGRPRPGRENPDRRRRLRRLPRRLPGPAPAGPPPPRRRAAHRPEVARGAIRLLSRTSRRRPGLLAVGESKPDPSLDAAELAAWTMLANQLMNLDEALNK